MNEFEQKFKGYSKILMEGALAERLKREYHIPISEQVALASIVYNNEYAEILKKLFIQYIEIANKYHLPIMITTPTRRANKERIANSNYDENIIKDNVLFLKEIREQFDSDIYIGGLMGCKGNAYKGDEALKEEEAFDFHLWQAMLFKDAGVDFLYAGIMPAISEAIGLARAMEKTTLPYIISFTIKKDGKLLDDTTIKDAIVTIDQSTKRKPICYMTNCVHPNIVYEALAKPFNRAEIVSERFKGIQANAACLSPEELDNCYKLVSTEPVSLARDMMKLYEEFHLKIFGGCCGTNDKHIEEIAKILEREYV